MCVYYTHLGDRHQQQNNRTGSSPVKPYQGTQTEERLRELERDRVWCCESNYKRSLNEKVRWREIPMYVQSTTYIPFVYLFLRDAVTRGRPSTKTIQKTLEAAQCSVRTYLARTYTSCDVCVCIPTTNYPLEKRRRCLQRPTHFQHILYETLG